MCSCYVLVPLKLRQLFFFFFFYAPKTTTFTAQTLMNELNNVNNTITSVLQKHLLNFMETKTLISITIKLYSLQPSHLSDALNDSIKHFFEQFNQQS